MKKKTLAYIAFFTVIGLVLCAVIGRTVEKAGRTEVTVTTIERSTLPVTLMTSGTTRYKNTTKYRAPAALTVTRVLCQSGQSVVEGTPLLEVDIDELVLAARKKQLAIDKLQNTRDSSRTVAEQKLAALDVEIGIARDELAMLSAQLTDPNMVGELQLKVRNKALALDGLVSARDNTAQNMERDFAALDDELAILRGELAEMNAAIPKNGIVTSEVSGWICSISVEEDDRVPYDKVLLEINTWQGNPLEYVTYISNEQAGNYVVGDEALVYFDEMVPFGSKSARQPTTYMSKITKLTYNGLENKYECIVDLGSTLITLKAGELLKVRFSHGDTTYPQVVPKGAVFPDLAGSYCIYVVSERVGLFGKETYAEKVAVKLLAENMDFCAIDADRYIFGRDSDAKVIFSSNAPIVGGEVVTVINE